ncbi:MAG TPA: hypothetical protein V6D13_12260 [Halomicronema sp.]
MSLNAQQLKGYILIFGLGAVLVVGGQPAPGIQLAEGKVYFGVAPKLVEAWAMFKESYSWYYFTVSILPDAGESLQRMEIL